MSINAVYEDSQGNVHESRMDGVDLTTKISIADDFSAMVNYAVGDFCYHLGTLYKCTTAHTAGAWNAAHFTATQVGDEIGELKNTLSGFVVTNWIEERNATSVPANSYANLTLTYTPPTGYQIIAVVAASTGNVDISIEKFDGVEKSMRVHNSTSNARDAVAGFKFLLMKV